jgi:hypothetical protein
MGNFQIAVKYFDRPLSSVTVGKDIVVIGHILLRKQYACQPLRSASQPDRPAGPYGTRTMVFLI